MAEAFRFRHVPDAVLQEAGLAPSDPAVAKVLALLDDRDRQLEDFLLNPPMAGALSSQRCGAADNLTLSTANTVMPGFPQTFVLTSRAFVTFVATAHVRIDAATSATVIVTLKIDGLTITQIVFTPTTALGAGHRTSQTVCDGPADALSAGSHTFSIEASKTDTSGTVWLEGTHTQAVLLGVV
ncbi:MAG: hypothetical protein ACLGIO_04950 [Acidimicrobiia bacterium]